MEFACNEVPVRRVYRAEQNRNLPVCEAGEVSESFL
jgi:hypothetical protein